MSQKVFSLTLEVSAGGQPIGTLVANSKSFKTGSTGFYAGDKLVIGGERYQVSCSIVLIGSKPKLAAAASAKTRK